ncbi:MAG: hypothetical protein ACXV8O_19550, partial [Methylobacter sp.]
PPPPPHAQRNSLSFPRAAWEREVLVIVALVFSVLALLTISGVVIAYKCITYAYKEERLNKCNERTVIHFIKSY